MSKIEESAALAARKSSTIMGVFGCISCVAFLALIKYGYAPFFKKNRLERACLDGEFLYQVEEGKTQVQEN